MFRRKRRTKPVQLAQLEELEPLLESDRPVFLDFFQYGCGPCQVMDGIVNELADEYADSAHIVKVNVGRVAGAAQVFKVRSTPTFILLGRNQAGKVTSRWRGTGLVKKDSLMRALEGSGAVRTGTGP